MTALSLPSVPSRRGVRRRLSAGGLGAILAAVAVFLTASVAIRPAMASLAGVVAVTVGVLVGRRLLVTVGATAAFGATLLAGVAGAAPLFLVTSGCAAMLAWDLGGTATDLDDTFEGDADVGTLAGVHAAGVLALVGGAGAAVYALAQVAPREGSGLAVLLLVAGGVLVVGALR